MPYHLRILTSFLFLKSIPLITASYGETTKLICFGGSDGGVPQNVSLDDISYTALYLRYIGTSNTGLKSMWSMPANVDCQEWELPIDDGRTVLPLAKHIGHRDNSTTLYEEPA